MGKWKDVIFLEEVKKTIATFFLECQKVLCESVNFKENLNIFYLIHKTD